MKQNNIASKQENQLTNEWHGLVFKVPCQRPYHEKRTWSRQLPAVKIRRVLLVPGRVRGKKKGEYRMSLASIIFFICNSKSFSYSSQPNCVTLKLTTALFQWFYQHFSRYFPRDGYQSNFLDETKQYRFQARKPTYIWMARVSFQTIMSTAILRKTHLVPSAPIS